MVDSNNFKIPSNPSYPPSPPTRPLNMSSNPFSAPSSIFSSNIKAPRLGTSVLSKKTNLSRASKLSSTGFLASSCFFSLTSSCLLSVDLFSSFSSVSFGSGFFRLVKDGWTLNSCKSLWALRTNVKKEASGRPFSWFPNFSSVYSLSFERKSLSKLSVSIWYN